MSQIDVSVIIVSYNTREMTLECIRSVYEQTRQIRFEVIVVDNASSDGSVEAVSSCFPSVRLICPQQNLGFGGANNLASEHATGEHLLLLNPDTIVQDNAIDKLHAFAKAHGDNAVFGGQTRFADGSLNIASCWGLPTLWSVACRATGLATLFRQSRLFNPEVLPGWERDTVRKVPIISGCFLMLPKSLWERLGGFDPVFFMYGEDADLCLRARSKGVPCIICPDARIIHYLGASEKTATDKMVRLFRAKVQLFSRHWSRPAFRLAVWLFDLHAFRQMFTYWLLRPFAQRWQEGYADWREIWRSRREWRLDANALPAEGQAKCRQLSRSVARSVYQARGLAVRLVYLFAAMLWLVGRSLNPRSRKQTIVLCYHSIGESERDLFDSQMASIMSRAIACNGWENHDRVATGGFPRVCVTFDDAFACLLENAVPVLRRYQIPFTVFAITGYLGKKPGWYMPDGYPDHDSPLMTSDDIRLLSRDPLCGFGSHTVTHEKLTVIPLPRAEAELRDSRAALEELVARPVYELAFPHGVFDKRVVAAALRVGYKRLYSVEASPVGEETSDHVTGRFLMTPGAWPIEFALTTYGAYAWLSLWRSFLRQTRDMGRGLISVKRDRSHGSSAVP